MRKYQRLSEIQRQILSVLLKERRTQRNIATILKVNQSTISRELKRHRQKGVYDPDKAQLCWENKKKAKRRRPVLTQDYQQIICALLQKHWSPEQIAGRMRLEGQNICCQTIYRFIKENRQQGGSLVLCLRRKGKPYRQKGYRRSGRGLIPNRIPIQERPIEVDSKTTFGHWEADTVVSCGRQGGLLTLVERQTKYTIVFSIKSRRAEEIKSKFKRLKGIDYVFKTITFDNGKEFSKHEDISCILKTLCYFATPYHSWERGINEHTNGLIREFFPKKMNLNKISLCQIRKLEQILNNRPRKVLGFRTPQEVFAQEVLRLQNMMH